MINVKAYAAVSILALGSLSACSSFDANTMAIPALETEISALSMPVSWTFGAGVDTDIATSWSDILDDKELSILIDEALVNNPSLRASAESIARADALLGQSRAGLAPFIGATVGANGHQLVDEGVLSDSYSASLSASWEADLWGTIRLGILGAHYDLEATKTVYRAAREALIANVARAYVQIIEATKQAELSKATLDAQIETLRIVNVRYELGAASRRELVLAESDVASARDNLVTAKSTKTVAILALQNLLGRYPDGELFVRSDFPSVEEAPTAGRPTDLLRRRPDILVAEYNVLAAYSGAKAAEQSRWPDLTLSAGLSDAVSHPSDLLDPATLAFSVGARLAGTLFDGGLTTARINAATATQHQAVAQYGQAVLDGFLDVETTLQGITVLEEREVYLRQGAEAARETLMLAEVQYKAGSIDLLDVLTFRQRSFQTDRTLLAIERQIIEARIALYLALGGVDQ